MTDLDPSFGQEILDVAQRQRVSTYIITTRRMTSGQLLKYRNGLLMAPSASFSSGSARGCDPVNDPRRRRIADDRSRHRSDERIASAGEC